MRPASSESSSAAWRAAASSRRRGEAHIAMTSPTGAPRRSGSGTIAAARTPRCRALGRRRSGCVSAPYASTSSGRRRRARDGRRTRGSGSAGCRAGRRAAPTPLARRGARPRATRRAARRCARRRPGPAPAPRPAGVRPDARRGAGAGRHAQPCRRRQPTARGRRRAPRTARRRRRRAPSSASPIAATGASTNAVPTRCVNPTATNATGTAARNGKGTAPASTDTDEHQTGNGNQPSVTFHWRVEPPERLPHLSIGRKRTGVDVKAL